MSELFIIKELISLKEMSLNKSSLIKQVFKLRSDKMLLFRSTFKTYVSEIIYYIRYAIDKKLVNHNQKE
jgi:hypothetical protein